MVALLEMTERLTLSPHLEKKRQQGDMHTHLDCDAHYL